MRVLELTNTYPPGDISGVGALAEELARALAERGHEVRVLTRACAPGDAHALPTGGPKLLFPLLAALRYLRLARSGAFDLVHVHESDGALLALVLRAGRALGLACGRPSLVATLQVSYVRERRAVRAVCSDGVPVSRPTPAERVFALGRAPILAFLGRLTARLADRVVAPSRGTARELEEDYGARAPSVIPNGVADPAAGRCDAARAGGAGGGNAADPERGPGGRPVVLYAGRLRTRKAVAVLVQAFAEVARALPGARLELVGSGEQRPALEAQVKALGLGDRVRFHGALARDRMAALYAAADVFCLPSTYEGFPVAILEAMSFGLPVVSTRTAGIPEAVEDGVTGFIVEPESGRSLAERLVRLGSDEALRKDLGAAGLRRFHALYRRDLVALAYLEVYADALRGRPRDPARP